MCGNFDDKEICANCKFWLIDRIEGGREGLKKQYDENPKFLSRTEGWCPDSYCDEIYGYEGVTMEVNGDATVDIKTEAWFGCNIFEKA